jgi:hypothetical protein
VKEEAKFRYFLYRGVLDFFNDGLGDGFDAVPDTYEIDNEEDYYENETDDYRDPISDSPAMNSKSKKNERTAYDEDLSVRSYDDFRSAKQDEFMRQRFDSSDWRTGDSKSSSNNQMRSPSEKRKIKQNQKKSPNDRFAKDYEDWMRSELGSSFEDIEEVTDNDSRTKEAQMQSLLGEGFYDKNVWFDDESTFENDKNMERYLEESYDDSTPTKYEFEGNGSIRKNGGGGEENDKRFRNLKELEYELDSNPYRPSPTYPLMTKGEAERFRKAWANSSNVRRTKTDDNENV